VSHPKEPRAFDLDEDLFDFAGLAPEPEAEEPVEDLDAIFASFREQEKADALLELPKEHDDVPPALPSARPTRARRGPHAVTPEPVKELEEELPPHELVPAARSSRWTKGAVAIGLAVTLLNSTLAVVALRGRASGVEPQAPTEPSEHSGEAQAAPVHEPAVRLPDPETLDVSHAHPTLDQARKEIENGEYAAARQRVYGLLAIIDRLEDPRREALEADCQFLVAQSLHLEALARMGDAR
jgi:hypothetical protein